MNGDLELRIGLVLKTGSLISTAFLALGLVAILAMPDSAAGPVLVNSGLVIVMITPVARVLVALVGFVQQREWRFVAMTVAILGVVAASVLAAAR